MENDSISIAAKHDATLEIARDIAKQSKTLAVLLASTDETRQKEPIRLPDFEASTLDKVFEWCKEHSGADADHKDFSIQGNFANEYARLKLTPWQADFFNRYAAHKWELAVAASYLDVPYLYYSTCSAISKSLQARDAWDEEVPESVPDDVLCDILRFFCNKDIVNRDPQQARWKRVIEKNLLKVVELDLEGYKLDHIALSTIGYSGYTSSVPSSVFDDLHRMYHYVVEERYAFRRFYIHRFGEDECAVLQAFLDQSSARLRVRYLNVSAFSTRSREAFRTGMSTLKNLAERLNFLEGVHLNLSCDMQTECLVEEADLLAFPLGVQTLYISICMDVDTESLMGFVEALCALWTRSLSIDLPNKLTDPWPLFTKIYEKFASDAEIAPRRITARVPHCTWDSLQRFAESRGFSPNRQTGRGYEKKHGNDWKIAVEIDGEMLGIEIKKVGE